MTDTSRARGRSINERGEDRSLACLRCLKSLVDPNVKEFVCRVDMEYNSGVKCGRCVAINKECLDVITSCRDQAETLSNKAIAAFAFTGSEQTKASKMKALREDAQRFKSKVEKEIRESRKTTLVENKTDKTTPALRKDSAKTKVVTDPKPVITPVSAIVPATIPAIASITSATASKQPEPETSPKTLLGDLLHTSKKGQFLAEQTLSELRKVSKSLEKVIEAQAQTNRLLARCLKRPRSPVVDMIESSDQEPEDEVAEDERAEVGSKKRKRDDEDADEIFNDSWN